MRALSIQQPWASLILGIAPEIKFGAYVHEQPKDVENRTWTTPHRGELLIHTGKKFDFDALSYFYQDWDPKHLRSHFTTGAILGIVTLTSIIQDANSVWAGDDCYHWMLSNPRVFNEPHSYRGQLGLFWVHMTLEELNGEVSGS